MLGQYTGEFGAELFGGVVRRLGVEVEEAGEGVEEVVGGIEEEFGHGSKGGEGFWFWIWVAVGRKPGGAGG